MTAPTIAPAVLVGPLYRVRVGGWYIREVAGEARDGYFLKNATGYPEARAQQIAAHYAGLGFQDVGVEVIA
jgi:hypothetical protein